jgi:hypothetical protein
MKTVTGNFESISGASTGYVVVTLGGYSGVARVPSTGIIVVNSVTTTTGSSFSVSLFPNDSITPANTYYTFSFYDQSGHLLAQANYSFTGSGTVDISTVAPM